MTKYLPDKSVLEVIHRSVKGLEIALAYAIYQWNKLQETVFAEHCDGV